jgi:subtilisin family serine protease
MKKIFLSTLSLLIVLSLATPSSVLAQDINDFQPAADELAEHVPGELLIRFYPGVNSAQAADMMSEMGVTHKRKIAAIGVHVVKLPPGLSVEQAIDRFSQRPGVEYVEPNYIMQIAAASQAEIVDQWGWTKIQTQEAWDTLGINQKNEVLLATVDTGIDPSQSDLNARIWTNPDETAGDGNDNDGNGHVDDTWGWDFVNNDNDPSDDNMHGTAVSSVMVANQDGAGMVGVCPWCKVMAVKVLGANGSGTLDVVASGITYAAQKNAKVINLSLTGPAGSQALEDAVNYAWDLGTVVIAAAGNDGLKTTRFPAGYANVISVASTNPEDEHSCFSNHEDGYISVAAPGEAIYVIDINNSETGYGYYSGTSLSAPHVAGVAGLLFGKGSGFNQTEVRAIIEDSAVDLGSPGVDAAFGSGRVDALRALTEDYTQDTPPDGLFSSSDTASGYAHARKLVRDSSGTLHMVWHTEDGSLYRIRHATSSDDGSSWDLQDDVFSSPNETYHPALATDDQYLFVAMPSRTGPDTNFPYEILFTRKLLEGGSWEATQSLMGGTDNVVRPDMYYDPSSDRLHVIASSLDDAPYLYYRGSGGKGAINTWDPVSQFNPSNSTPNTRYATIHANGDNLYVATKTVDQVCIIWFLCNTYYYLHTARSIDGGVTWIDQQQISSFQAVTSGEYGVSLAGVGDRLYMGYEVYRNIYFRRYDDGSWSDYLLLEEGGGGDPSDPIVYKWPTITQAADGQAWLMFEDHKQLYMRHYDGSSWAVKESMGGGTYANFKLGTSAGQIEWLQTGCNGSPFEVVYNSRSVGTNTRPEAHNQTVETDEDIPVDITLTGSDLESPTLSFTVTGNPAHGTLSGTEPDLTYTSDPDFNGTDSFTFVANDGIENSLPGIVTINIIPVNDAPVASDDNASTPENIPVNIDAAANDFDIDGDLDATTVSATSGPQHGTLDNHGDGTFTYYPETDFYGSDSFDYRVCDSGSLCDTGTVYIAVSLVNFPPVANSDSVITPEDTQVAITLTASDPDGDDLSFRVESFPVHGTLSGTPPDLFYSPDNGYTGSDSFTFIANDGFVDSAPGVISITITSTTMHIGDLDPGVTLEPRNRWAATVTISVHDSAHNPISLATVAGSWSDGASGDASCETGTNGTCEITKANLKGNLSSVTFTVNGISHATLAYNPADNHDPDQDSDGTEIVVYQAGSPTNQPPEAIFTSNCADLTCAFDASASYDPEGPISSYSWDFGDGNTSSGMTTNHGYSVQGNYTVVLTVYDGEGLSSSDSQEVFPGVVQVMHVGDLDGKSEPGKRKRWNAYVDILVHDGNEEPVQNAAVSGSWSGNEPGSCTTDATGWCTINLANISTSVKSVNFSITDLSRVGWEYDLTANHEPDPNDGSNGTSITISFP